jgi:hypothetical protein
VDTARHSMGEEGMVRKLLAFSFALLALFAAYSQAGVPKVIIIEEFGATW